MRRRNEALQEVTKQEDLPEENHEARNDINNNDIDNNSVVDEQMTNLQKMIKTLSFFMRIHIQAMDHCLLLVRATWETL